MRESIYNIIEKIKEKYYIKDLIKFVCEYMLENEIKEYSYKIETKVSV